jgi:hypothetical protein
LKIIEEEEEEEEEGTGIGIRIELVVQNGKDSKNSVT